MNWFEIAKILKYFSDKWPEIKNATFEKLTRRQLVKATKWQLTCDGHKYTIYAPLT